VVFTHARCLRRTLIRFGWFSVRPPDSHQTLRVLDIAKS